MTTATTTLASAADAKTTTDTKVADDAKTVDTTKTADAKVETKTVDAAAAQKAADEAALKPFTDVAQLKLADGQKLDEAIAKDFLALAKEQGLTAKQAQALLDYSNKGNGTAQKATEEKRDAAAKSAIEALKSDKEIGGANFDKSMVLAGKALQKFGNPDITKALLETRLEDGSMLGDNVHIAKLLVSVGKAMAEDTKAGTHSNGAAKTPALASQLYPKSPALT